MLTLKIRMIDDRPHSKAPPSHIVSQNQYTPLFSARLGIPLIESSGSEKFCVVLATDQYSAEF